MNLLEGDKMFLDLVNEEIDADRILQSSTIKITKSFGYYVIDLDAVIKTQNICLKPQIKKMLSFIICKQVEEIHFI